MPMNSPNIHGARQWLRLSKEAVRGERKAEPVEGDQIYLRLDQGNAFSMMMTPAPYQIRGAEALNQVVQSDFQTYTTPGTLNTLFYPSQAGYILGWASELTSSGSPATYSAKTVTIDWFNGKTTRSFLGVHLGELKLTVPSGQPARWALSLQGWKEDTATAEVLAEPAFSVFPTDLPFNLSHTSGGFKLGSDTARVQYQSFEWTLTNMLAVTHCESQFPDIDWSGRDSAFTTAFKYKADETDEATWRNHATLGTKNEITFTRAGSHTVKLDFETRVKLNSYAQERPLEGNVLANISGFSMYDSNSPAGIFAYTITAP